MLDPPDRPPLLNPTSTTNQTIQPTQISESQATSSNRKRPPNRGSRGRGRGNHGNSHRPVDQTQSHESINNNVLEGSTHGSTVTNTPAEAESSQRANTPKRGGRGGSARRGSRGGNRSHGFRGHAEPKDSDGRSTADETGEKDGADAVSDPNAQQPKGPSRSARRRQFGSKLTTTDDNATPTPTEHSSGGHRRTQSSNKNAAAPSTQSKDMDLTSRLTAAFSRTASPDDAPDCPICFSTIGPGNPTWSCSPTLDGSDPLHDEHGVCCWTSFHLKCIKSWAAKSTKETREAYLAREVDNVGEWRCPGCQTRRSVVPRDYRCFCGRVIDPKPGRLATPHSCGDACSRRRITCEHPCPLPCHPGPCPPCLLTITQQCHCGAQTLSLRCSNVTASGHDPSKQRCRVTVEEKCRCGRIGRQRKCWEVEEARQRLADGTQEFDEDEGVFTCDKKCTVPRNCGKHICGRICCPLAALAGVLDGGKGKKKQREIPSAQDLAELDPEGWHICDLVSFPSSSLRRRSATRDFPVETIIALKMIIEVHVLLAYNPHLRRYVLAPFSNDPPSN
ncbi:FKBP12-associated protein [Tulasnella sp. 418]|nr:FKBP12-associated protein [Tulasnella sp. 418]